MTQELTDTDFSTAFSASLLYNAMNRSYRTVERCVMYG